MRTPNGRGLMIGAVVAAGVVVVLSVLAAGPVQVEAPRWSPAPVTPTPIELPGAGPGQLAPTAEPSPIVATVFGIVLQVLFFAGVAALLAVLVVFIVRRIQQRRRLVRRRRAVQTEGGGVLGSADGAVPAPVMRRGIARALQVLDADREPSDAVIQAWLGLEETAADAGAGRAAAETPAEYTARIVQRFDTDREAAQALLRLYQDVRFGARAADAASVAAARECLVRLQASWHEAEVASR
ncbi:DUF4129 domain-containing protein [Microbacterium protaetiae]|uniref:DUF4129 domain-containing protein n=1 Tax=Microbacterium protaetiae TaxID=2509458 RepID=A0A4P6EGK2_9MICO|nr:DUF4129 domain-containing protein [Microbacterium protaetiae]QAY61552.1 DUF4129 domain-containing protein [Microbacterium protaetiae]